MEPTVNIWPGSSSFSPGDTPFGYFDSDTDFIIDADRVATWCARRLGYPITDVELQQENFYAAFEEAASEFGNYVNLYNARDNMTLLRGSETGSNATGKYLTGGTRSIFRLARQYGTEIGAGGELTYYTGSINIEENKQVYDLKNPTVVDLETGSFESDNFTIRRIFHGQSTQFNRYLDPTGYSGLSNQTLLNQFGWSNYGITFTLMPLHYDLLRFQAIEMHTQIRKSTYSFELTKDRIRIFPIPETSGKIYFQYTLDDEAFAQAEEGKVTDISNMPYYIIPYSNINDYGKRWIKRYALALSKEMLGLIRSKYSSMPYPGAELSLNGSDLLSAASTEMEALVTELKEMLDSFSNQAQLERKQAEGEALQNTLSKYPKMIYIR